MSSNRDNRQYDVDVSQRSPCPRVLSLSSQSQTKIPQNRRHRRSHTHQTKTLSFGGVTVLIGTYCLLCPHAAALFSPRLLSRSSIQHRAWAIAVDAHTKHSPTQLCSLSSKGESQHFDPDVTAQIEKAKQLLDDARKKQEGAHENSADAAAEAAEEEGPAKVPFFAARSHPAAADKIKSFLESGEIVADGETMASLSASEPWERRSLSQMFANEARMDYDGNVVEEERANTLAERDEAASIYNLRKKLMTEDFKKVFDRKNMFIGEVD